MKVSKGQSQRISAFLILHGSGSTILVPGFEYDSHVIGDGGVPGLEDGFSPCAFGECYFEGRQRGLAHVRMSKPEVEVLKPLAQENIV